MVEGEDTVIEGDEDLLHRVVANLVLNAVQARAGSRVRGHGPGRHAAGQ